MGKRSTAGMPALFDVAEYWLDREEFYYYKGNYIGLGEPFCSRCGWLAPIDDSEGTSRARWGKCGKVIERAHLVDHALGGSDDASNLVPLCYRCHKIMPSFGVREEALSWVRDFEHTKASGIVTHCLGMNYDVDVTNAKGHILRGVVSHNENIIVSQLI